jgi:hypothetical protein
MSLPLRRVGSQLGQGDAKVAFFFFRVNPPLGEKKITFTLCAELYR